MRLEDLICLHDPKSSATSENENLFSFFHGGGENSFIFSTCQRNICLLDAKYLVVSDVLEKGYSDLPNERVEVYRGWQAYAFLLRVLCGLESKVFGETEVFGQFRTQWSKAIETTGDGADSLKFLAHWVPKLFSDVKKIRSEYLAGFGGSSYASLCKSLLEKRDLSGVRRSAVYLKSFQEESAIGVIGFGKLAQSMCSVFRGRKLIFWNRSEIADSSPEVVCSGRENLQRIWQRDDVKVVIVTIPVGSEWDRELAGLSKKWPKVVVHLGAYRKDLDEWHSVGDSSMDRERIVDSGNPMVFCLDDIFELSSYFQPIRKQAYQQAKAACEKHSKMRLLGNTLHATHCWEDLAFFSAH